MSENKIEKKKLGLEKTIIILLSGMLVAAIGTCVYFAIKEYKNEKCNCQTNEKEATKEETFDTNKISEIVELCTDADCGADDAKNYLITYDGKAIYQKDFIYMAGRKSLIYVLGEAIFIEILDPVDDYNSLIVIDKNGKELYNLQDYYAQTENISSDLNSVYVTVTNRNLGGGATDFYQNNDFVDICDVDKNEIVEAVVKFTYENGKLKQEITNSTSVSDYLTEKNNSTLCTE